MTSQGMTDELAHEIVAEWERTEVEAVPLHARKAGRIMTVHRYYEAKGFLAGIEHRKKQEHTEVNELKGLLEKLRARLIEQTEPPRSGEESDKGLLPMTVSENFQNKRKEKIEMKKGQAVLVTTEFRGVFFGFVKDEKDLPNKITLTKAKNCIYWSSDCNGFLGLAANGPTASCKIGVEVPELTLWKITSVTPITDAAVEKWNR